ncbi:hypothetical protein [Mycolicibacterium hodleri]|uniref:Uncharacterized protein n=1 Tax=Mycolicibacterium hodleri TaxID=49897 RepID=A0A502EG54_9MYCO|nr:hypothetical protein [Mycolicibacterium hodleri]TPG36705.1 hypothetical protein EAH80_01825 [Mycolicibacterium hodleri]
MQPPVLVGQILGAVAPRLDVGGEMSPSGVGGIGNWVVTLSSLLAVLVLGGTAAKVAGHLMRRSTPELILLLNQSAQFYSRWPEDRLAGTPRVELMVEAARCRRIIDLLESQHGPSADRGPATRGPIDGMRTWAALLHSRIGEQLDASSRPAFGWETHPAPLT